MRLQPFSGQESVRIYGLIMLPSVNRDFAITLAGLDSFDRRFEYGRRTTPVSLLHDYIQQDGRTQPQSLEKLTKTILPSYKMSQSAVYEDASLQWNLASMVTWNGDLDPPSSE